MPHLGVLIIWESPFMFSQAVDSLLNLQHPPGWTVTFHRGRGWSPARRHQDACEKAVQAGADVLLILGADQVYEPDLLCRLLARREEGYEAVAALVPARGFVAWNQGMTPFQRVAWRFKSQDGPPVCRPYRGQDVDGDMVEMIDPAAGEMQPIHFIGSGVLMFDTDHLLALKRPWFYETVDHESQIRTACMDTRFCFRLLMEAGADVWVDTTIQVRHLHIFAIDETFSARFADWATPGIGDPAICNYGGIPRGDEEKDADGQNADGQRHADVQEEDAYEGRQEALDA